ncbi:hypothetical protein BpHYR1_038094 [Brachionus plicatilis]|uniref:Uncharacterized protein n=1 Tax=Brachionus plicatilis TaxID=10195 RepID=A0A3M7Q393_BRAPC|nr:hypothetical protein BpHYR1_038094 [Brachionus plicatilis]
MWCSDIFQGLTFIIRYKISNSKKKVILGLFFVAKTRTHKNLITIYPFRESTDKIAALITKYLKQITASKLKIHEH